VKTGVCAAAIASAAVFASTSVAGKPTAVPHPPPLGALPSVPRVRLEVGGDHVVVIEEVDLPRGDWRGGELSFYVAFGAPGAPDALDAHLLAVPDGALEPLEADVGEKLTVDRAPRRPATAHALLGPEEMAGVVVHASEALLRRAFAPGGMAALRLRSLVRVPVTDAQNGQEVVVRLGHTQTTPLTLGRVQVASTPDGPEIGRAEAHLCGPSADPWPLAVAYAARRPEALGARAPIAPVLAVRHPDDDLCVRFWWAH
jgi:hypothetical protein